jgi:D-alanyl-D-alanine carboxypeptidase (penicillin-binding protein 5/6)
MARFILKLILSLFLFVAPFFAHAFETSAQYAILLDYNTGKIIYSKNSSARMTPSSMSKLMTLYIVFSELKNGKLMLDDMVTVSEKAWRMEGSKMFIEAGAKVKVSDLMKGIIIQSGNDASIALAEHISGDEDTFVERMNAEAKRLGLNDSHFANATGLPNANHYMTAYDLAILSKILIKEFPEFYQLFSEKEFTYNNITQPNRNYEIGEHGIDGIKTGHTSIAGYGIVASALNENRRLIAVVNGLDSEASRMEEMKKLLNYGFNNFYNLKLVSTNTAVTNIPVWHGNSASVDAVAVNDLELVLPRSITADQIKITLKKPSLIYAPIAKGENIADLIVKMPEGEEIIGLGAATDIKQASFFRKLYNNFIARISGS